MLAKFLIVLVSGLFFLHSIGDSFAFAYSFTVTIFLGATIPNIDEPMD